MLRECIEEGLVEARPDARHIPRSYYGVWATIHRAKRKAELDPKIQPCHGFRKYFENLLDDAGIDHERKMLMEGHFAGTRAKHYTERDLDELRGLYSKAYSFIAPVPPSISEDSAYQQDWRSKIVDLQTKLSSLKLLEAKLHVLEDRVEQLSNFPSMSIMRWRKR